MAVPASTPPPDTDLAPKLLIPVWILFGIALALYVLRIRTRIKMVKSFYADDYAITLAMLSLAVEIPAMTLSCRYGLGRHSIYVPPASIQKAMYYMYISIFPVYIGTAAARISIGLTLLRLKQDSRIWTRAIWTIIVVLAIQGIANTVIQATQCIPTEALWRPEMRKDARCMTFETSRIWGWLTSVVYIVSDVFFSLLPLTFIPSLHLPLRQKFLISLLMSLGMVASTASIVKTFYIATYQYRSTDVTWNSVEVSLWSKLEECLIALAACAPTLKGTADRICIWFTRMFRSWRERTQERKQTVDGDVNRVAGLDMVRDEEMLGRTRKMEAAETDDEELRPKWWFLPHGFIHTDLITTLDLDRRSDRTGRTNTSSSHAGTWSEGTIGSRSVTDSNV